MGAPASAQPVDYTFSYQGRLKIGGGLVDTVCQIEFSIWDQEADGNPLAVVVVESVPVQRGLFVAQVDVADCTDGCDPAFVFNGEPRWLQVEVFCPGQNDDFEPAGDRQLLTSTPFASHAFNAGWTFDPPSGDVFLLDGDVGVHRSNPVYPLHVAAPPLLANEFEGSIRGAIGVSADQGPSMEGESSLAAIDFNHAELDFRPLARIAADLAFDGSRLLFGTSGSYLDGITNTAMVIDELGNVGIGTSSPTHRLHVAGLTDTRVSIGSTTGSAGLILDANNASIAFGQTSNPDWCIYTNFPANNNLLFQRQGGGGFPLSLDQDNRVGINIPVPTSTLHVNGDVLVEDQQGGTGDLTADFINVIENLTVGGSVTADQFFCAGGSPGGLCTPSDARLKTDVEQIPDALARIGSIRGVYFKWRDGEDAPRQVGVIAQEVERVVPEAVRVMPDEMLGVTYDSLVPVLVEAVKKLDGKLRERDRQIAEMSARLAAIEAALLAGSDQAP